jgi:POT family proton-dependent oligopeptide transporter
MGQGTPTVAITRQALRVLQGGTMRTVSGGIPKAGEITKKCYPAGLYSLCAVVGAERFSFYLLSTFLVLYLNERLGLSADRAVAIYGYFLCISYLTPLLGGQLADSRLGAWLTALLGCAPLCLGYLALFVAHVAAALFALLLITIGGGLFKAGVQTLLGRLFTPDDSRRADGFSRFYVAVNIGALSAPLVGSLVLWHGGWLSVFVLCSCGMLGSVAALALGRQHLAHVDKRAAPGSPHLRACPLSPVKFRLALVLLAGLVFGVGYVQSHSSVLLWVRDRTDRRLGPFDIPVAWFAAAPAALVLLLASPLSTAFGALRRCRCEPSTVQKIVLGLSLVCLAFVPLWAVSLFGAGDHLVSPLWVLACLAILATAELLVPALAPAEILTMAPPDRGGRWLSYWFVALASGHVLGGWIHF